MMARTRAVGLGLLVIIALAGCTATQPTDPQQNYVSGDGTVTEFAAEDRGNPVVFSGTTEHGEVISSDDFAGKVVVVNFWYATCPPCRLEAPWLEELYRKYSKEGVEFLGVNVRDDAAAALVFADTFEITYPSIIDRDAEVVLAFSGIASPTAVPTTVVLGADGRPASRIVGLIDKSILDALIRSALAESGS